MSQKQKSRKDGAVAVMTALMVLLMLSIGALAVDLGNAMTRKRDTQSQADFATLAGAGVDLGLPNASTSTSATDPAIKAAASYLYKNQPQNDLTAARRTALELASDLVDHNRANGEAYYGDFGSANPVSPWTGVLAPHPSVNELTIVTPPQMVKFGLASAMGFKSTHVQAAATAKVASPGGTAVMPMFAVNGCDYGPQMLTEPANGQQVNPVPTMDYPTATASNSQAGTTGITQPTLVAPYSMPHIEVNDTSPATFQVSGRKLTSTTYVGFFHDTSIYPDAPAHLSYALNNTNFPGYNVNNGNGPNGQLHLPDLLAARGSAGHPGCLVRPAVLVLSGGPGAGTDHTVGATPQPTPCSRSKWATSRCLARASPATEHSRDTQAYA